MDHQESANPPKSSEAGNKVRRGEEKKDDGTDLLKLRRRIQDAVETVVPRQDDQLLECFTKARKRRKNSLIMILGSRWTDKTALALSLKETIDYEERGYFLRGSFTQLQLTKPHAAIFEATRSFARQVIGRGEQEVDWVRKRTRETLGDDACLLSSLLPRLGQMLGGGFKKKNKRKVAREGKRFLSILGNFLAAMASQDRPIIVFMENLHLADQASLDALKTLIVDHPAPGLVFLATCDTNVSPTSTLAAQLRELEEGDEADIKDIVLRPLGLDSLRRIVAMVLECDQESECEALCQFIHNESKFTPRSLSIFLEWALSSNSIFGTAMFGWSWDEKTIRKALQKDMVKSEIQSQARNLGDEIFSVLVKASCLGVSINLSTLDIVTENAAQTAISEAAAKTCFMQYERGEVECSFCCEESRESLYEYILENERGLKHLSLGKKIWKQAVENDTVEKNVFLILSQVCKGAEAIVKEKEKIATATLCVFGGQTAAKMSAFNTALHLLQVGISLLPESSWNDNYDLTHSLHVSAAELAVHEVAYDVSDMYVEAVLRHGRCMDDMVPAYCSRMMILSATGRAGTAVDTGLNVLKEIGLDIPAKPGTLTTSKASLKIWRLLRGKSDEQLLRLPLMTSLEKINAMRVLTLLQSYTHMSRTETHAFACFKMIELTCKYGHSPMSSMAFAWYGVSLVTSGNVSNGYRFAQLSLSIQKEYGSIEYLPRLLLACYGFVFPWKKPYASCLPSLQDARKLAYQTGDTESAGWSSNLYNYLAFEHGMKLDLILDDWAASHKEMEKNGQNTAIGMSLATLQTIRHLMGLTTSPLDPRGDIFDFDEAATAAQKSGNVRLRVRARIWQMRLAFIFNEYRLASKCAMLRELESMPTSLGIHGNMFFGALVCLQACREGRGTKDNMKMARGILGSFEEWSLQCPENFTGRKMLIEAELASVEGKLDLAYEKYICAVALSHGNPFDRAIATERVARHLLGLGEFRQSLDFFQKAISSYAEWGAKRKAEYLEEEVSKLFDAIATDSEESLT